MRIIVKEEGGPASFSRADPSAEKDFKETSITTNLFVVFNNKILRGLRSPTVLKTHVL